MSLTNDQITAKNFKEFYEQIRPYLNGNFPTPIANKFDKANMYSTDEQIVGRWIDGKPLYQKTFTIASMQKDGYEDVLTGVDYAQTIAKTYRRMQDGVDGDDFWYASSAYVNVRATCMDDGTLRITNCSSVSPLTDIILTAQYTKATDTAMDIGSDTDYSTTEKIVGTWIDGKPIYQKTWDLGSQVEFSTTWTPMPQITHTQYNMDVVIKSELVKGMGSNTGNNVATLVMVGAETSSNYIIAKAPVAVLGRYLTLQYTKTTD